MYAAPMRVTHFKGNENIGKVEEEIIFCARKGCLFCVFFCELQHKKKIYDLAVAAKRKAKNASMALVMVTREEVKSVDGLAKLILRALDGENLDECWLDEEEEDVQIVASNNPIVKLRFNPPRARFVEYICGNWGYNEGNL